MMHADLIYDFGVNDAGDTEFYLLKGFRVVGVEANPELYRRLTEKFSSQIATGQLVLLNIGIWPDPSILTFYLNRDNDHWSSFDPTYGCRNGTRFETIEIQCCTAAEILRRFGVPYYLKIDIEGADKHVLSELMAMTERPPFISVEEFGIGSIDLLHALGYPRFKVVPQRDKSGMLPPNPALEGTYVPRRFSGRDSGLFGKELAGEWMDYGEARAYFLTHIRDPQGRPVGPRPEWHDVHAAL
jgi:FkbM family methyltransferase